jgi:hypothetical protein
MRLGKQDVRVWFPVWDQARDQVWYRVLDQARGQVLDQVWVQVGHRTRRKP